MATQPPASRPRKYEPCTVVTMKAIAAASAIIPSTLRFNTPDFSATSSPRAANTSGVAVENAVARTNSSACMTCPNYQAWRAHRLDPIIYEEQSRQVEDHQ